MTTFTFLSVCMLGLLPALQCREPLPGRDRASSPFEEHSGGDRAPSSRVGVPGRDREPFSRVGVPSRDKEPSTRVGVTNGDSFLHRIIGNLYSENKRLADKIKILEEKLKSIPGSTGNEGYCGPTCFSSTCRNCRHKGEALTLDLSTGKTSGSLTDVNVQVIQQPKSSTISCGYKALLKATFQPAKADYCRNLLKINAEFGPRREKWMLNFGDSASNNGYGGDGATQSRDSEIEMFYNGDVIVRKSDHCLPKGSELERHSTNTTAGVADAATFWLGHNYYRLKTTKIDEETCSDCLYDLNNGADFEGKVNRDLYLAFNRVVSGNSGRDGFGTCKVQLSWECNTSG